MDQRKAFDWTSAFASRTARMHASEIRELLKVLDKPGLISLAGGIPDPSLFPLAEITSAYARVLGANRGRDSLQYSVSEGYLPLREWLAAHMHRLGVPCGAENIVITSGSQQGLEFLGKLLISKSDTVLVSAPTYLGALQAFNAYEPSYDCLTPGLDALPNTYADGAARRGGHVAFAYVVPDFANPTGETMTRGGRDKLLDLTAELGIPLIEDAAYSGLRFEGEPIASCLALDIGRCGDIEKSRTVYCGTFSKTISPGLRVGWICAARKLVEKLVLTKQASDLHSATINQIVLHEVAEQVYDEQVRKSCATYTRRRDAMLTSLARFMPAGVLWNKPEGGMFLWLTLPTSLDGDALLAASLTSEKVAFVPGRAFFVDRSGHSTVRLNYSLNSEPVIEDAIRRLAQLVARSSHIEFRAPIDNRDRS